MWGMSEQHLLPDAVVAFVDGELSPGAHQRAADHAARCPCCSAEIAAQRQARAAVRSADAPGAPAGLLAALRAIPHEVDLPSAPDGLAMTRDGQFVTVQRPEAFAGGEPLGSSTRLGEGRAVLGRRAGAGVVVSGLVLGALALVNSADQAPVQAPAAWMHSPGEVDVQEVASVGFGLFSAR
ncbi:zf-HC2 domain-containing protein [Actinokineospora sp. NPDC004072]